ncbi:hypothetical protein LSTR_LSTR005661 [Laodelphax striatellus]|uniref:Uncharacterized protein n=1 Tax=Laodelphax striatellus TaxID=195883 RepID=A0A482X832_LAOST|nr:hypothetical protein LSTR_LSTR005661 [Laodelphax striatellus]
MKNMCRKLIEKYHVQRTSRQDIKISERLKYNYYNKIHYCAVQRIKPLIVLHQVGLPYNFKETSQKGEINTVHLLFTEELQLSTYSYLDDLIRSHLISCRSSFSHCDDLQKCINPRESGNWRKKSTGTSSVDWMCKSEAKRLEEEFNWKLYPSIAVGEAIFVYKRKGKRELEEEVNWNFIHRFERVKRFFSEDLCLLTCIQTGAHY